MRADAYRGHRVGIVGSCQASGLGLWTQCLLPGAEVEFWHVGANPQSTPDLILSRLPGCDLVVSQIEDGGFGGRLDRVLLRDVCGQVIFLPMLVFRGFHPDCVTRVHDHGTRFFHGPMGPFHSALVIAAFRLRVPPSRVAKLFNTLVFRSAGYHTVFAESWTALLKSFAAHDFDLDAALADWMGEGAFMYTDNHPHLRVLERLARMVLAKAGLATAEPVCPPPDNLACSVHWPVYPDLARPLGVAGSTLFRRSLNDVAEPDRDLCLAAFIAGSYQAYEAAADIVFSANPVVDATLAALEELVVEAGMLA